MLYRTFFSWKNQVLHSKNDPNILLRETRQPTTRPQFLQIILIYHLYLIRSKKKYRGMFKNSKFGKRDQFGNKKSNPTL